MGGPLLLKKINILERVSNAKATMTFKNNPSRNKNVQAVAQTNQTVVLCKRNHYILLMGVLLV